MQAFHEISTQSYTNSVQINIKAEIEKKEKDYILNVSRDEYISYLSDRYSLQQLTVFFEKATIGKPTSKKEWFEDRFFRERYQRDVYKFVITLPFIGSADLFRIHPDTWMMTTHDIDVNSYNNTVSLSISVTELEVEKFNNEKDQAIHSSFSNIPNANSFAISFNFKIDPAHNSYERTAFL